MYAWQEEAHRVPATQGLRPALAHADVVELPLVLEDDEVLDRLLDGPVAVDPRGLEEVDLLRAAQGGDAVVDALAEALQSAGEAISQAMRRAGAARRRTSCRH